MAARRMLGVDKNGFVTFILSHEGDQSVGIHGDQAKVHIWVGRDREYQEFVRDTLRDCFSTMWDFRTAIVTDAELRAEEAAMSAHGDVSGRRSRRR